MEECILHSCKDTGELATSKGLDSWNTLLNAATIRNHEPILEIAQTLEEGELAKVTYHRQYRSVFTHEEKPRQVIQIGCQGENRL